MKQRYRILYTPIGFVYVLLLNKCVFFREINDQNLVIYD